MTKAQNRTPAQAAIARKIAIRNAIRNRWAAGAPNNSRRAVPSSALLAACVTSAGFSEHAAYGG